MHETSTSGYGSLAALVYEIDKPVGRSFGDIEFYRQRLRSLGAKAVLEPAAGNGRMLIPLHKDGFELTGFDNSPHMLAFLRRNCTRYEVSPDIAEASFADFKFDRVFDAVVLPAGTFQLLEDRSEALAFLKRCWQHLRPGGSMILDLDAASAFAHPEACVREWRLKDGRSISLREDVISHDVAAQTVVYAHHYRLISAGELRCAQSESFRLRWWRVDEAIDHLHEAGFTDVTVSGNYCSKHAPGDDDTITMVATRP